MTREEAIEWLQSRKEHWEMDDDGQELAQALEMGIEALENQKTITNIKYDLYNLELCTEEAIKGLRANKIITAFEYLTSIREILNEMHSKIEGEQK